MKIKDLNEGNYVKRKGEYSNMQIEYFEKKIIFFKGYHYGRYLAEIEPIQLSKEWLDKFGFTFNDYKKGYCGKDIKGSDFPLVTPENINHSGEGFRFVYEIGRVCKYIEIKHVHQLQNLFYALTDEDLNIVEAAA